MDFGAHLPLIGFDDIDLDLKLLETYTETAESLGFSTIASNDHFVFSRPWLDGPTTLSSVIGKSGEMQLATTIVLPVIRGPASVAKSLGAIDILSNGRLIVGVGPGSSPRDYETVGIPFEERWKRLDESISVLRSLWSSEPTPVEGRYYSTTGVQFLPLPAQVDGPPIWIGSWGSDAGMRRVARLADGWLASGYNTSPKLFGEGLIKLNSLLSESGKDPLTFPNAIATMWTYITEDEKETDSVLSEVLAPMVNRSVEELRDQVLIGSAEHCASLLTEYRDVGAQRVLIWPVKDPVAQLSIFMKQVATQVH